MSSWNGRTNGRRGGFRGTIGWGRARRGEERSVRVVEFLERRTLLSTFLVTNTNDSGPGSLRQAMTNARNAVGHDFIHFNIPGPGGANGAHTIQPLSQLPVISDAVTIDGYTQPGCAPNTNTPDQGGSNAVLRIEIDGTLARSRPGIAVGAGSTLRGLIVNRFSSSSGLELFGTNGFSRVEGCFIGTDPTGTVALGNSVGVALNTHSSVIGGTTPAARNVISGNVAYGVFIAGAGGGFYVRNNLFQGNLIGTDATGTRAVGNGIGVDLSGAVTKGLFQKWRLR